MDQSQDLRLRRGGEERRSLGEALDELIEKLFCGDLEVEGVAYVLDEVI